MRRIEQDVRRFRQDYGRHAEEGGSPIVQPIVADRTRRGKVSPPVGVRLAKLCGVDGTDGDVVWDVDLQQLVGVREVINVTLQVNEIFQQGECGMLGQVNDGPSAGVPPAGTSSPAFAAQIGVVRDAPEPHDIQAKMP